MLHTLQEATNPELSMAECEGELGRRGGFVPLMHLFPQEADHPGVVAELPPLRCAPACNMCCHDELHPRPTRSPAHGALAAGHDFLQPRIPACQHHLQGLCSVPACSALVHANTNATTLCPCASAGLSIPWTPADRRLAAWAEGSKAYAAALS
jgi:hypothetical protein